MRAQHDRLDAFPITLLDDPMQRIRRPIMQLGNRLPVHRRLDGHLVRVVVVREQGLHDGRLGRRRVVEPGHPVPLADAILAADLPRLGVAGPRGQSGDGGRDGLHAAVEGGRVDALDGRREGREMGGEFVGLLHAVAGEGWVAGDAGGRGDRGAVFARLGVNDPVGAELCAV